MLRDPLTFLENVTAQYGGVVGLILGGQHVAVVTDPAIAKDVLIDQASLFAKARTSYEHASRSMSLRDSTYDYTFTYIRRRY